MLIRNMLFPTSPNQIPFRCGRSKAWIATPQTAPTAGVGKGAVKSVPLPPDLRVMPADTAFPAHWRL